MPVISDKENEETRKRLVRFRERAEETPRGISRRSDRAPVGSGENYTRSTRHHKSRNLNFWIGANWGEGLSSTRQVSASGSQLQGTVVESSRCSVIRGTGNLTPYMCVPSVVVYTHRPCFLS